MFDIVKDIDQWGKGSLFKYGFLQSLVIMLIFLLCAWLCKRAINRWIRKKEMCKCTKKISLPQICIL